MYVIFPLSFQSPLLGVSSQHLYPEQNARRLEQRWAIMWLKFRVRFCPSPSLLLLLVLMTDAPAASVPFFRH
jgi:hypothetical protein